MLEKHLGGHSSVTHLDEGSLNWFKSLGHQTFLDIGCGPGGMVELAETLGFNSFGIDGDYTLKRYNDNNFMLHDFTHGPAPITELYDIGWSVEFVEHVEEKYIPNYVQAMLQCKNLVITHAVVGQTGHHHVNCQDPLYWINTMKTYGFKLDEDKTAELRNVTTLGTKKKHRFIQKTGMYFVNENI
tara:strand:- start:9081 stop:9635 length:555 start_codon:yes stop_codon:yes gene_type:complete